MCGCAEQIPGRNLLCGEGARPQAGILLLEALIGLAIISMVAISLLAATGSQVRSATKADVLLTAAALAQDRLAALQLLDAEGFTNPPDSLLSGTFSAPFDEFTWTAEVEEAEGEYDLYAVSITIEGRGEWFPLETLLHRPPLTAQVAAGGALGGGAFIGAGQGMGGRGGRGRGGQRGMGDRMDVVRERLARMMGRGQSYRSGAGRTGTTGQQGTGRPPPGGTGTGRPPPTGSGAGQPPPAGSGTGQGPPEGGGGS